MATITLTVGAVNANQRQETAFVYVKQKWSDGWTYVPYVYPVYSEQNASPSVDTAVFKFDYGLIQRPFTTGYAVSSPLELEGWYISVYVHGRFRRFLSFSGVISESTLSGVGAEGTLTSGDQTFGAHGLDELLSRGRVQGSYKTSGLGDAYIDRTLIFNRRNSQGVSGFGNRSEFPNTDGIYNFSRDGFAWSNLDMINYVLYYFQPEGVPFQLWGATDVLESMHYEFNPDGLTVLECIDRLIDRRRGLGWTVDSVDHGVATIFIFTTLSHPVNFGDYFMPANYDRVSLWSTSDVSSDTQLVLRPAHNYSRIIVRGDRVKATMSFSYDNATLEEGWSAGEEALYTSAGEHTRNDDAFKRVFGYHRVPDDFDYSYPSLYDDSAVFANPALRLDGTFDFSVQTEEWGLDSPFDSFLPFAHLSDADLIDNPYRTAFVLIGVPVEGSEELHYGYSDSIQSNSISETSRLEDQGSGVSDVERAFWIHLRRQYHFGLNVYTKQDGDDSRTMVDYRTMVSTATVPLDTHSKVIYEVPGFWDSETSKELVIDRPDVQVLYVAPGTVSGVVDGAMVFENGGAGEVIRDDTYELRAIAGASVGWYGQQRNTLELHRTYMSASLPVGVLVLSAQSSAFYRRNVGTVVTSRRYDYRNFTTQVRTGFHELDVSGSG